MIKKLKKDFIRWTLLIGIVLFLAEILFFHGGAIFFLFIAIGCIYIGRQRRPRLSGTVLFWFGLISIIILIINMASFRFLLFILLIYMIVHFIESKQTPTYIKPVIQQSGESAHPLFHREPLLKNVWFGSQKTPEHIYEWNDVNIQVGIGDTIIDLSYTVLPKGESVVVIRNFIGNVQILVPYELEVCIHHSVVVGSVSIFEHGERRVFNETMRLQTEGYEESAQKVKIVTSMVAGNLEVKRI